MLKKIIILAAVIIVSALVYFTIRGGKDDQTLIAQRVAQQDAILGGLQAANDATVRQLVRDWRKTYPEPSPAELTELREIQSRIRQDKSAAAAMTIAYKLKNVPKCIEQTDPTLLPKMEECKPGL